MVQTAEDAHGLGLFLLLLVLVSGTFLLLVYGFVWLLDVVTTVL